MSRRSRLFVSTQVKDWGQSPLSRVPDTTGFPIDPATLSPSLWLDASDATTITASSGDVSQWNNKGSLGNFTQATGAVQPKTGATTLNGRNVIDFAGDYLTSADAASAYKFMHDGTKFLVCFVAKHNGTFKAYLGNNTLTTGETGFVYYSATVNTTITAFVSDSSGSSATIPVLSSITSAVTNDAFVLHSAIFDPGNGTAANRAEMFFAGGSANKVNSNTATPSANNPTRVLQIGAAGNDGSPLTGSIAEVVIVSGANATETNRAALRDYLNDKWAVY
jgi:hypothetical protein